MRPFWDEKLSVLASDAPTNERAAIANELERHLSSVERQRDDYFAEIERALERRANAKQDATRKRVALWLEEDDCKALERIMRKHKLPSRIAALRWLVERAA